MANREVDMDAILTPNIETIIERIRQHRIVLAPHDTIALDYTYHPDTTDLEPLGMEADETVGLMVHGTLAFTVEGTPLGILDAQCRRHDGGVAYEEGEREKLPMEESNAWLPSFRTLTEVQKLCPDTMLVSMGDRASDIHEPFHFAVSDACGPKLKWRFTAQDARRKLARLYPRVST